jgi:hypothetical protein
MNRWTVAWFLPLYDKRPFVGSLVGLAVLIVTLLFIGLGFAVVQTYTGLTTLLLIFMASPLFLILLKPCAMIVLLASEFIWRSLGLYRILGIQGAPIRKFFCWAKK